MVEPVSTGYHSILLQWAFGALVVVLYARDRFDSPHCTRATTTLTRYWVARLGYIAAMLALFLVLGGALGDLKLDGLRAFLGVSQAVKDADRMPGPLLAALVLTSMLPSFPLLTRVDQAVNTWFRRIGNIPFEARLLSSQLQQASLRLDDQAVARIADQLAELGVDPSWLREAPGTIRQRWARTAVLWELLQDWTRARGYSRYVAQRQSQFEELRTRLESIGPMMDDASLREFDTPTDVRAAKALRRKVKRDVDQLYEAVCDFISSGVLDREWNLAQRNAALAKLGFEGLPDARGSLGLHEIALIGGLIFIAMVLAALIARRFFSPTVLDLQWRVLVTVPIIYSVAIVLALYPKAVWAFADIQRVGHRPYAAYLVSGVLAAVAAFGISLLFRYLFEDAGNLLVVLSEQGRFDKAFSQTADRWPWLLMTTLTTIAIAFAADNWAMHPEVPHGRLRAYEAAGLAFSFAVFQWIVVQLLAQVTNLGAKWYDHEVRLVLTATVIGACIGFLVPHLHRKRLRAEPTAPAVVMPQVKPA